MKRKNIKIMKSNHNKFCILFIKFALILMFYQSEIFAQNIVSKIVTIQPAGGLYAQSQLITISGNADYYLYTTDGTRPVIGANRYRQPLKFDKTTVLRVRPVIANKMLDTVLTNTYFIGFKTTFSVVSLTTNNEFFFDNLTGIYVKGPKYDTILPYRGANFWKGWEKPVHFEMYDETGKHFISQDCGVKIFGGFTRALPEKSLMLTARKKYGKGKFKGEFFEEKSKIKKYDKLVLRTSGGDYNITRFLDVFITQASRGLGVDYQAWRPVVLFFNGNYWGVYNLREKINEDYLASNHGANPDSLDLLELHGAAMHGNTKKYDQLTGYIAKTDLSKQENYRKLGEMMDIRNYLNYTIIEIIIANPDSRGNIRFWRAANLDNKFHWILFDTDLGFGQGLPYTQNFLHDRLNPYQTDWYNPTWATHILRGIVKNPEGRNDFINQICYILSTNFQEDTIANKVEWFRKKYEPEMARHFARNGGTMKAWHRNVDKLKKYGSQRPKYMKTHLMQEFNLKDSFDLRITIEPAEAGYVKINDNKYKRSYYHGTWFMDIPIPIEAIAKSKFKFVKWEGKDSILPAKFILNSNQKVIELKAIFTRKVTGKLRGKVHISEIYFGGKKDTLSDWVEIYNQSEDTINISNWQFTDKKNKFLFPEKSQLLPNSILILTASKPNFKKYYSEIEANFETGFGLGRKETLYLLDDEEDIVDSIRYNFTKKEIGENVKIKGFSIKDLDSKKDSINFVIHNESGTPGEIEGRNVSVEKKNNEIHSYKYFLIILCTVIIVFIFVLVIFVKKRKSK